MSFINVKQKVISRLPDLSPKHRLFLITAIGLLLIGVTEWFKTLQSKEPKPPQDLQSIDTFIPAGMSLVPLDIQNPEALQGIIDEKAVVDVFATSLDPKQKPLVIGRRVRLLRAPLNTNVFAALVPENEVAQLLSSKGPVTIAIRNPQAGETNMAKTHKSRIVEESWE